MTLKKRIVPCLDVKGGRVVKGVKFENLRDLGDPAELAERYYHEGADEVVFLDIGASKEERKTTLDVVRRTAECLFIPLTVGGGIRSVEDVQDALSAGADKVSFNTAAVLRPDLIAEASDRFGAQCVVVAIDARSGGEGRWEVFTHGGTRSTGMDAVAWAHEAAQLGAGEICSRAWTATGRATGTISRSPGPCPRRPAFPSIASGGAGGLAHFADALSVGKADAALAASLFHERQLTVGAVRRYLLEHGVAVRPEGL